MVVLQDEARHASLAWRTVQWAIAQGGASVAKAVAAAFQRSAHIAETSHVPARGDSKQQDEGEAAAASLEHVGVLDASTESGVRLAALSAVVAPLAAALVGGSPLGSAVFKDLSAFAGAEKAAAALLASL
jgi:hypothetical protein